MHHATGCRARRRPRRVSVVDQQLASGQTSGRYFWHRFNFDGYGEKKDGTAWDIGFPANPSEVWANNVTIGRNWPIFGGERGEYELLVANTSAARAQLGHMAAAGNDGYMLPEQVWAPDFAPAGEAGLPARRGNLLSHPAGVVARAVRQARLVNRRRQAVEQPSIVATRYARE
jgi:glucoamylase